MLDNFSVIKNIVDAVTVLLVYKVLLELLITFHSKKLAVKYVPKLIDRLDKYIP